MKKQLRKELIRKRREMTAEDVRIKSAQITERVINSGLLTGKQTILIYMDFKKEVQTDALIRHLWNTGHTVVLPRVIGEGKLALVRVDHFDAMERSSIGILEPVVTDEHTVLPSCIDLVLVPGVAFDLAGYRLGYGGGYYDRLLPQLHPDAKRCALAFECQVMQHLPREAHDQRMDYIQTEERLITVSD